MQPRTTALGVPPPAHNTDMGKLAPLKLAFVMCVIVKVITYRDTLS